MTARVVCGESGSEVLGDTLRRRNPAPPAGARPRPVKPRRGPAASWARWLLAAIVILLGSFGTGYLLATQVLFPAPETAGTGVSVPDLYGADREGAEGTLVAAGLGVGRVLTLPSLDVPAGRVLAQSPVAGQQLRPGATVDVTLSAGPPELLIPPLDGLGENAARALLEEAGFAVDVKQIPSPAAAGTVARTDPPSGTATQPPATVTLFVSIGPPTIDPMAMPPDDTGGTP
ncbi:MAG: PASTA domain-containing protein [Gemmatimonadetes bacterium]|nr:PASTA domain-containing protein [Gemmatimonadota bacterium]